MSIQKKAQTFRLSENQLRSIEEALERGSIVEVKIERSVPVVVEIRRKLLCRYSSGEGREEIQRDHN